MFDARSRYRSLPTAVWTDADGRTVTFVTRRFLPRGEKLPTLVEIQAGEWDRLDHLAARTLGDAEAYWRLCDANNAMDPATLLAEQDGEVRVAIPAFSS